MFEVKDANLQGTVITMHGQRSILVQDKASSKVSLLPQPADATIQVELGNVDRATALPQLTDELFFPSVPSALAAIPRYLRRMVPYRINVQPKQSCTDCTHWMRQDGTWQELPASDAGLQNPQFLKGRTGDESPVTGKNVTRLTASFAFVVDETGHPAELWLTRPAGYGVDEPWADGLRKEVFWPAKYHGAKVAVPLGQDVAYQHF